MKLSIYTYLFNATKREFDLDGAISNFIDFADEVVIATIPSEDDTYERLIDWEHKLLERYGRRLLRVVMTDIKLANNRFDGDLKTAALRACSKSTRDDPRAYIIADCDERFPLSNKPRWVYAAERLFELPIDGFLIPVLDLYQDEHHIRADQTVGVKFRLHKDTVVKRGVIPEAELGYDNLFRADMSDSTEPLNSLGHLAQFVPIVRDPMYLWPQATSYLNQTPYVLHYGHLDADRRARLNREFWREHWLKRSGQEPTMVLNAEQLKSVKVVRHQVALT